MKNNYLFEKRIGVDPKRIRSGYIKVNAYHTQIKQLTNVADNSVSTEYSNRYDRLIGCISFVTGKPI
jgi:hypothetical protein